MGIDERRAAPKFQRGYYGVKGEPQVVSSKTLVRYMNEFCEKWDRERPQGGKLYAKSDVQFMGAMAYLAWKTGLGVRFLSGIRNRNPPYEKFVGARVADALKIAMELEHVTIPHLRNPRWTKEEYAQWRREQGLTSR